MVPFWNSATSQIQTPLFVFVIFCGQPYHHVHFTSKHAPEENVESKHGKHDSEVSDHSYSIAELVNEEEPLIHHPVDVNQKALF